MDKIICAKCGKEKEANEFPKGRKTCKVCVAEYKREYYLANRVLKTEKKPTVKEGYKLCTKCGKEKPLNEFYRGSQCKECIAEYTREYKKQNKEKQVEYSKTYYKKNKESISVYKKELYSKTKVIGNPNWREAEKTDHKVCTKCGEEKHISLIYKGRICKECQRLSIQLYRLKARGIEVENLEDVKKYEHLNKRKVLSEEEKKERKRINSQKYREKNREIILEKKREYNRLMKDEVARRKREKIEAMTPEEREAFRKKNAEQQRERRRKLKEEQFNDFVRRVFGSEFEE